MKNTRHRNKGVNHAPCDRENVGKDRYKLVSFFSHKLA